MTEPGLTKKVDPPISLHEVCTDRHTGFGLIPSFVPAISKFQQDPCVYNPMKTNQTDSKLQRADSLCLRQSIQEKRQRRNNRKDRLSY